MEGGREEGREGGRVLNDFTPIFFSLNLQRIEKHQTPGELELEDEDQVRREGGRDGRTDERTDGRGGCGEAAGYIMRRMVVGRREGGREGGGEGRREGTPMLIFLLLFSSTSAT